jgi:predicted Zn-dependent peptidase
MLNIQKNLTHFAKSRNMTHSLSNGLRIIYRPTLSSVSYCGFAINAGTRDEAPHQLGLAHFVEHMLFKGTKKRKAWHILNRMESVGGELNAYTTKEETFIYSICLSDNSERAIELLADLIFHSQFPPSEIEKEREVILDEINSYKDTPSELIFDEFENLLFKGNEIGHNILGEESSLNTFTTASCHEFVDTYYQPENIVFFFYGKISFEKVIRLANRYFLEKKNVPVPRKKRIVPGIIPVIKEKINKNLHQTNVIIGGRAYDRLHEQRMGLYLLNNLLGGPCMNSRLNITLREKQGLVYSIESGLTSYSDCGVFNIYFGCDPESEEKCISLIYKELKKIRTSKLTTSQLNTAIKQLKGQLGIAGDQNENVALKMGKSFLHFNKYDDLSEIYKKIDVLTSSHLLEIANEIMTEDKFFHLIYK